MEILKNSLTELEGKPYWNALSNEEAEEALNIIGNHIFQALLERDEDAQRFVEQVKLAEEVLDLPEEN
jgi:hypothetical protein